MFFIPGILGIAVVVLIGVLIASGLPPDQYVWMLLVALAWFAGFMDSHFIHKKKSKADKNPDAAPLPESDKDDSATSDKELFK